jgi:hypothetical protein
MLQRLQEQLNVVLRGKQPWNARGGPQLHR